MMLELHPDPSSGAVDPAAAVAAEPRRRRDGRPWIMSNMIVSADGATAIDGRSGGLGSAPDRAMFAALRAVADAIVVGAETVRSERYRRPTVTDPTARARRSERGQAPAPRLVIVTGRADLPDDLPLFTDPPRTGSPNESAVVVTTRRAPAHRVADVGRRAEVVVVDDDRVSVKHLIDVLAERGCQIGLCEGGPGLNGQFIAADAFDEWNLTVAPLLVAGASTRPAHGDALPRPPAPMRLARVWLGDELLFCRWVRRTKTS
ncbi:MAG: dihydrofolate reductase family protein [Acidimicrobiales bacterium]